MMLNGRDTLYVSFATFSADAKAYEQSDAEGKVVVAGSSSVTPVMEKLKEAYEKANGGKITVEVQQSDPIGKKEQTYQKYCQD